ncbi:MAG: CYTH domain-containing protein [Flammeovirgaceae bacterium]
MAIEIERKFLLKNNNWQKAPQLSEGVTIKQGYLSVDPTKTVRVRVKGEKAFLTIKGKTTGISRLEYEYEIPKEDALALLKLCSNPPIEKTRFKLPIDDLVWEIDVFEGENQGLTLAEVELASENQALALPIWVGEEVSTDRRYFNAYLSEHPYNTW